LIFDYYFLFAKNGTESNEIVEKIREWKNIIKKFPNLLKYIFYETDETCEIISQFFDNFLCLKLSVGFLNFSLFFILFLEYLRLKSWNSN
jgi:hypothetical protein